MNAGFLKNDAEIGGWEKWKGGDSELVKAVDDGGV